MSKSLAAASPEQPVLPAGVVIGERYRIDRLLGGGGMAMVYRATHLALGQYVAIKVLSPTFAASPGMAERFLREARAATYLRSAHIARVLDVGTMPAGTPYMVMEYLEGKDLESVLASSSGFTPDPEDAVRYVLHACAALAEVHGLGIVHRDLKPANLFLTRGPDGLPFVKLIDFGIARVDGRVGRSQAPHHTDPEVVMGTPRYMAPEQMKSATKADARSDIWSLGVVLYELLTGETPYVSESLVELYAEINGAPPIRPSQFRPEISPALDAVVLKCLAPAPSQRFADVAELADALVPFGGDAASMRAEDAARVLEASRVRESEGAIDTTQVKDLGRSRVRRRGSSRHRRQTVRSSRLRTAFVIAASCAATTLVGLTIALVGEARTETTLSADPARAPAPVPALVAAAPVDAEPTLSARPSARAIVNAPARVPVAASVADHDVAVATKTAAPRASAAPSARPRPRPEPPRSVVHLFED